MSSWFTLVAVFSSLAFGLLGGIFLAFSDFLMRSLAQVSGSGGVEAMQAINREVFRIVFMVLFIGMAPVSVFLTMHELIWGEGTAALMITAAGLIYLMGCFVVTVTRNVPLNQKLDGMETDSDAAIKFWREEYVPRWTFWNTVRTCACVLAAALTICGLVWPL